MNEPYKYRAGVLIIGSLLWDNSEGRKPWREHAFGEDFLAHIKTIQIPIRYGRFSKKRQCPTMIFSGQHKEEEKLGTGILIPFANKNQDIEDIICSARNISQAEGHTSRKFIKGGKTDKWCVLVYWANPRLREDKNRWNEFLNSWINKYDPALGTVSDQFRCRCEEETIFDNTGALSLNWPADLEEFDLILTTQPKPTDCYSMASLSNMHYSKPKYFLKNRLWGITTPDDDGMLDLMRKMDIEEFREHAKKDGCSEEEIEKFLNQESFPTQAT